MDRMRLNRLARVNRLAMSGDSVAPTVVSATVPAGGATLVIVFSEPIVCPSGSYGVPWDLRGGANGDNIGVNGDITPNDSSALTSPNTLTLDLGKSVLTGNVVTLDYTPGDVQDIAGNLLAAFTGLAVTNNA